MKTRINADLCVGCGLCVSSCPEVFEIRDDKAVVKVEVVPAENEEICAQAKDECPVEAIIID